MKNRIKLNVENLKSSIADKKRKKTDLALEIGVTRETFSRWLAGRVEYIDENKLIKLSELLECDMSWLSPEIAPSRKNVRTAWKAVDQIRGDDFIRMGLYSGLWRQLATLYGNAEEPEVVENGEVNQKLCLALQALMNLDSSQMGSWGQQPEAQQKNHELFEVIARHNLVEGIALLFSGSIEDGHRVFKRVIIQARSEWLISMAYLMSGFCYWLKSSPKEASETWVRGLQTFPHSQDDLTLFVQANLRLSLCVYFVKDDSNRAQAELQQAKRLFETIGYRYGHARCLAHEALCLSYEQRTEEALAKAREAAHFVPNLPRLYQLETLLLLGKMQIVQGSQESALPYIEIALDLTQGLEVFACLVKNQLMNLGSSNEKIREQVAQLKKKWPIHSKEFSSRKVL